MNFLLSVEDMVSQPLGWRLRRLLFYLILIFVSIITVTWLCTTTYCVFIPEYTFVQATTTTFISPADVYSQQYVIQASSITKKADRLFTSEPFCIEWLTLVYCPNFLPSLTLSGQLTQRDAYAHYGDPPSFNGSAPSHMHTILLPILLPPMFERR